MWYPGNQEKTVFEANCGHAAERQKQKTDPWVWQCDKNIFESLMGMKARYKLVEEKLVGEKMTTICIPKPCEKVFSEGEQRKYSYWEEDCGRKRSSILATRRQSRRKWVQMQEHV